MESEAIEVLPDGQMAFLRRKENVVPERAVSLKEVIDMVREDSELTDVMDRLRSAVEYDFQDEAKKQKGKLPAVAVSAMFKSRGSDVSPAERKQVHSGLIQLDFDAKDNPDYSVEEMMNSAKSCGWVVAAFRSPSGNGVKAIARIAPDFKRHRTAFLELESYFKGFEDLNIDPSTKDPLRLCFLSHDENAWFNESASRLDPHPEKKLVGKATPLSGEEEEVFEPTSEVSPEEAERVLLAIKHKLAEGGDADGRSYDGRPHRDHWLHISFATFGALGRGDGIDILCNVFPEEERGEYAELFETMPPDHAPWKSLRKFGVDPIKGKTTHPFPPIRSAAEMDDKFPSPPESIIEGILSRGSKMMVAAPSKVGKTWLLLELAQAVGSGGNWLGTKCIAGDVLFLNFELQEAWLAERRRHLGPMERVKFATLRGYSLSWADLIKGIRESGERPSLIILDPIYKMLGDASENDNTAVASMLSELEKLAHELGAAVVFAHHYSKGNKANASTEDRAAGAGVFMRDPDATIFVTPHVMPDCYAVEMRLRNFRLPEPTVWRRGESFHWEQVQDANPRQLLTTAAKNKKGCAADAQKILQENGGELNATEFKEELREALGCSVKTAGERIKEAVAGSLVVEKTIGRERVYQLPLDAGK